MSLSSRMKKFIVVADSDNVNCILDPQDAGLHNTCCTNTQPGWQHLLYSGYNPYVVRL